MNNLEVKIPATSANLGPGFDCLGLALNFSNKASIKWQDKTQLLEAKELKAWAENLPFEKRAVACAYSFYALEKSLKLPKIEIEFGGDIPIARGLGSSATCAIAGIAAAQIIDKNEICKEELLVLGTKIEGHPDNIAPAVFGGLMLSKSHKDEVTAVNLSCHENIRPFLLIPDFELSTAKARAVLPKEISHKEAVKQLSSFGFLLAGLKSADPAILKLGREDYLHEKYRHQLISNFDLAKKAALNGGCQLVALSGAGPSLIAFFIGPKNEAAQALAQIAHQLPLKWQIIQTSIDYEGTAISL